MLGVPEEAQRGHGAAVGEGRMVGFELRFI